MMAELGVAVLGVGTMGAHHVDTLERLDLARVVAVADPDEKRARACIGRRPIDWHADWRAVLERPDVDAITIATPTEQHAEMTLAALATGRDVLVEKPIATSVGDALQMATAASAAGRKLMVGQVERFNPAVRTVAELLRQGRVGKVFRVTAVRVGPLPVRIANAGVAMDLATHDLDIMQHLLGRDPTRIYAQGGQFTHTAHEDILTCLLTFGDDGPFGLLDVNWLTPEKRREFTVLGEGGLIRASYLTQDVWFSESAMTLTDWDKLALVRGDAEGSVVRIALRKVEPLAAELEAFARCILDDLPEPVTAHDGARALAAAVAVRESARASRAVDVLEIPAPV
jgi:predicted dehydrogenase